MSDVINRGSCPPDLAAVENLLLAIAETADSAPTSCDGDNLLDLAMRHAQLLGRIGQVARTASTEHDFAFSARVLRSMMTADRQGTDPQ